MSYLGFQRLELREDLLRRNVYNLFVNHLFVSIEGEIEAIGGDIGEGYAKALSCPGPVTLGTIALGPAGDDVGEVVLRVFRLRQHRPATELFFR